MDPVLVAKKKVFHEILKESNIDEAYKAFRRYISFAKSQHYGDEIGQAYSYIIDYMGGYDQLEQQIYLAVEYMNMVEKNQKILTPYYYAISASLEMQMGNYEEARLITEKEYALQLERGSIKSGAMCLSNISFAYLMEQNYVLALERALEAKKRLMECENYQTFRGYFVRINLAQIYLALGETEKTQVYLEEVLRWDEIEDYPGLKMELYMSKGRLLIEEKDFDHAILQLEEAIEMAETSGMHFELRHLYKSMSDLYECKADYGRSSHYLKAYAEVIEGISNRVQKSIKYRAVAEMDLSRKEKIIQSEKHRYQEIFKSDEYDLLTNTFSLSYMEAQINRLMHDDTMVSDFRLISFEVMDTEKVIRNDGFREVELLLIEVAEIIGQVFTRYEIGRIDRRKFMVLVNELGTDKCKEYVGHVNKLIREHFIGRGHTITVNTSLVDNNNSKAKDAQSLIRMANLALYQAEASNDHNIVLW